MDPLAPAPARGPTATDGAPGGAGDLLGERTRQPPRPSRIRGPASGPQRWCRPAFGHLTVVDGPSRLLSRRFALRDDEVSIGRTEGCYVAIPDQRVSRLHVQVVRDGERLFLVHRSQTNQTFAERRAGRRARAAPRRRPDPARRPRDAAPRGAGRCGAAAAPSRAGGLREAMEARVALEDRIALQFVRDGSFLDVDVVDSYNLKAAEERPERVVVSFERFRALVEGVVDGARRPGAELERRRGDGVLRRRRRRARGRARHPARASRRGTAPRTASRTTSACASGSTPGARPSTSSAASPTARCSTARGTSRRRAPVGGILLSKATYDGARRARGPRARTASRRRTASRPTASREEGVTALHYRTATELVARAPRAGALGRASCSSTSRARCARRGPAR